MMLRWSHLIIIGIVILLVVIGHWYGPLYANNHFHHHRWSSDVCRAKGLPPEQCGFKWKADDHLSTESAYFDICLEHGEFRRIK